MSEHVENVTILFLRKDDQILLAMKKRGFGDGLWNGVGGKQKNSETIEDTAIRECQEEIGVKPLDLEQVAKLNFYFAENKTGSRLIHYAAVYVCSRWEGDPIETEEMRPKWFNIKDVPYNKMWPDDTIWLPKIINNQKIEADFYFDDNNSILKHQIKALQ